MPTEPFMDDDITNALELLDRDRPRGMKWLESLAKEGNATAILYFALSLSEEVNRQTEEIEWLLKASSLGFSDAAWNLAMIYNQNGDQANVKRWIDKAAELGNNDAAFIAQLNYDVSRFLKAQY
jgi:TPR repeat protein